jgi:hypothetical protein
MNWSDQDAEAYGWAMQNPDNPFAAQIKKKLEGK